MIRMYHVIVINIKTGKKVYMTAYPIDHDWACNMLRAISDYPWRQKMLDEVKP